MLDAMIPKVMASGAIIDLAALKREEVNAWDIAWALAHIDRYTGACPTPWNVLRHTMLCVALAERECALVGEALDDRTRLAILLHDASEAYVGDVAAPLKRTAMMEPYRRLENGVDRVIRAAFDLVGYDYASVRWSLVKKVDGQAYDLEMRTFWPGIETVWPVEDRSDMVLDPTVYDEMTPFTFVTTLQSVRNAVRDGQQQDSPLFDLPDSLWGRV